MQRRRRGPEYSCRQQRFIHFLELAHIDETTRRLTSTSIVDLGFQSFWLFESLTVSLIVRRFQEAVLREDGRRSEVLSVISGCLLFFA